MSSQKKEICAGDTNTISYRQMSVLKSEGSTTCSDASKQIDVLSSTKNVCKFPVKLLYILNEMKNDGLEDIACWHVNGKSFEVKNVKEFEKQILSW